MISYTPRRGVGGLGLGNDALKIYISTSRIAFLGTQHALSYPL